MGAIAGSGATTDSGSIIRHRRLHWRIDGGTACQQDGAWRGGRSGRGEQTCPDTLRLPGGHALKWRRTGGLLTHAQGGSRSTCTP